MLEEFVTFGSCRGLANIQSNRGVLLVSGFFGNKDESHDLFKDYARVLHERGFSTLRYDANGIGTYMDGLTVQDWEKDALDAIQYFTKKVERVGLVGFSLGATHIVNNMAKNTVKNVSALALWSPAFDPRKDMLNRYKAWGDYEKARNSEFVKYGNNVSKKMMDSLDYNILDKVVSIECPVYICHSKNDPFLPLETTRSVVDKFKQLYFYTELEHAGHSFRSLDNSNDDRYRNLVYNFTTEFFQRYL